VYVNNDIFNDNFFNEQETSGKEKLAWIAPRVVLVLRLTGL